jgi:tetratricopeptide (TPR) repeat protein
VKADTSEAYLERVQTLAPGDPSLWYFCGVQEMRLGWPARAGRCWRRSLELSDRHLKEILSYSKSFEPEDLARDVIPEQPDLLMKAAKHLYPGDAEAAARRPYLQRALTLLDRTDPARQTPEQLQTRAQVLQAMGETDECLKTYRRLLERDPSHIERRCEFARLLSEEGFLREARSELLVVLAQQPRHARAQQLLGSVDARLLKR